MWALPLNPDLASTPIWSCKEGEHKDDSEWGIASEKVTSSIARNDHLHRFLGFLGWGTRRGSLALFSWPLDFFLDWPPRLSMLWRTIEKKRETIIINTIQTLTIYKFYIPLQTRTPWDICSWSSEFARDSVSALLQKDIYSKLYRYRYRYHGMKTY